MDFKKEIDELYVLMENELINGNDFSNKTSKLSKFDPKYSMSITESNQPNKKKSLRGLLGLPISGVLYGSPQFDGYKPDSEFGDGGGVDEMIQIVREMHDKIGKKYEVYDIEEAGIPLYTAQFEPDMSGKEVNETNNRKKYKVSIKNPETGKIISVDAPEVRTKVNIPKKKKSFKSEDKKNPRHWSSKFWSNSSIKNLLAEIIEPDNVDISLLKFNNELCPLIWNGNVLDEDVRKVLLKNAIEFIKSCKIEEYKYKDIVLVGSMANFTYTPQSDIDIHIVIDFDQFRVDHEILGEYFDTKKDLWSANHDIKIKGHTVECYIQNSNEPYTSIGVYSLIKDEWLREPIKKFVTIDEGDIQLKAASIMNTIDKLEERLKNGEDILLDLKKIKDKIKNMRKNGLYKEGEYSTENLVFKVLRNSGYLEKVINLKNNNLDQNLSI